MRKIYVQMVFNDICKERRGEWRFSYLRGNHIERQRKRHNVFQW